jgi:hypothetical protein
LSTELTPIAVAAEELRASAEDMEQAAWRTGLTPDEPLGIWVISLRRILTDLADLSEVEARGVSAVVEGTRKLVDAEISQLRAANEGAVRAMNEANAARSRAKIEAEKLTLKTIADLAPKILEEIRDAVVIRERRYNRTIEVRRACLVGAAVLGLFLGGYSWRARQDGNDASAALVRCLKQPLQAPDGERYCAFSALFPQ